MTWIGAGPAVATALVLLVAPGAAVGWAAGLRGIPAWGAAAPLSVTVLALGAVAADPLGVTWGAAPAAAATLVAALVAWSLGRRARPAARGRPALAEDHRAVRRPARRGAVRGRRRRRDRRTRPRAADLRRRLPPQRGAARPRDRNRLEPGAGHAVEPGEPRRVLPRRLARRDRTRGPGRGHPGGRRLRGVSRAGRAVALRGASPSCDRRWGPGCRRSSPVGCSPEPSGPPRSCCCPTARCGPTPSAPCCCRRCWGRSLAHWASRREPPWTGVGRP